MIAREAEAAPSVAAAQGEITAADAAAFRAALLTTDGVGGEVTTTALPVWAAAAIVGCAGSVSATTTEAR